MRIQPCRAASAAGLHQQRRERGSLQRRCGMQPGREGRAGWAGARLYEAQFPPHPACTFPVPPQEAAPAGAASWGPERGGTRPDGCRATESPRRAQPRAEPCQGEREPNLNYQPREWLWIPGAPVICGRFFRSPPVIHTRRYLSSHPRTCGVLVLHNSGPCQLQVSAGFELGALGWVCSWGWGGWREELL